MKRVGEKNQSDDQGSEDVSLMTSANLASTTSASSSTPSLLTDNSSFSSTSSSAVSEAANPSVKKRKKSASTNSSSSSENSSLGSPENPEIDGTTLYLNADQTLQSKSQKKKSRHHSVPSMETRRRRPSLTPIERNRLTTLPLPQLNSELLGDHSDQIDEQKIRQLGMEKLLILLQRSHKFVQRADKLVECPILMFPMEEPVVNVMGKTYEKSALERHYETKDTDPVINNTITDKRFFPSHLASNLAQELGHPTRSLREVKGNNEDIHLPNSLSIKGPNIKKIVAAIRAKLLAHRAIGEQISYGKQRFGQDIATKLTEFGRNPNLFNVDYLYAQGTLTTDPIILKAIYSICRDYDVVEVFERLAEGWETTNEVSRDETEAGGELEVFDLVSLNTSRRSQSAVSSASNDSPSEHSRSSSTSSSMSISPVLSPPSSHSRTHVDRPRQSLLFSSRRSESPSYPSLSVVSSQVSTSPENNFRTIAAIQESEEIQLLEDSQSNVVPHEVADSWSSVFHPLRVHTPILRRAASSHTNRPALIVSDMANSSNLFNTPRPSAFSSIRTSAPTPSSSRNNHALTSEDRAAEDNNSDHVNPSPQNNIRS